MARRPQGGEDDAPWLAEGVREPTATLVPRARLFGGGLIAVLLAVAVGLGVYLASGHKSDGSTGYASAADAPLIAADTGPYKVPPENPGGAKITGIDDTIAAAASGRDPGSALLPETSEEPLARPSAGAGTAAPTDLLPADGPRPQPIAPAPLVAPPAGSPPSAAIKPEKVVPPKPLATAPAADRPAAKKAPEATKPTDTTATAKSDTAKPKPDAEPAKAEAAKPKADAAKPASDATKPKADAAKPAKTDTPHDAPKDTATRAAAFDPDKPAKGGTVTLQLGAFSTRDKADAAWAKAGGDGALAGLAKRIEPVERNGTTLYRLRAGGVAAGSAAALCGRLKAAGVACIVAE